MSDDQTREARYYAAVHSDSVQRGARAAMALADAELDALRAIVQAIVDNGLHLDAVGYRNAAADALIEIHAALKVTP